MYCVCSLHCVLLAYLPLPDRLQQRPARSPVAPRAHTVFEYARPPAPWMLPPAELGAQLGACKSRW